MQELVGGWAVDGVWAIEEFDFGFVAEAQLVVVAADLGVFERDPLVDADAVVVAAFDLEGSGRHQVRQYGVVGDHNFGSRLGVPLRGLVHGQVKTSRKAPSPQPSPPKTAGEGTRRRESLAASPKLLLQLVRQLVQTSFVATGQFLQSRLRDAEKLLQQRDATD